MKIFLVSVFVNDQEKALRFYTEKLGFVKKQDLPVGDYRWLTVVQAEGHKDVELVLEPNDNQAARSYQDEMHSQGIPLATFAVEDLDAEFDRLKGLGVKFPMKPTQSGDIRSAVLDDTVGNLIQLVEKP